jgi:hypothetical protein
MFVSLNEIITLQSNSDIENSVKLLRNPQVLTQQTTQASQSILH